MGKRTPFYALHEAANAKIVDFAGWDMPLHYGSQLDEHHIVRKNAGMFDVSHMGIVDVKGEDALDFLRYLLANNIDKIAIGRALYTCMLNEQGGVIDDLIVYRIEDNYCRLIVNAGTKEKDLAWIKQHAEKYAVTLQERSDLVMLAVQGPEAIAKFSSILPAELATSLQTAKPFSFLAEGNWFIAKTGYTGEDGVEVIFPAEQVAQNWQALLDAGVKPCGLGARDTLRLEAGLNLYGSDMDETVTPLVSNLAWTVAFEPAERKFIGRDALIAQKEAGVPQRLVGLVLDGAGIMRNHAKVVTESGEGEVTSGGYSPTLEKSIGLARVPVDVGATCDVMVRNKTVAAHVVKPPFVRQGKQVYTLPESKVMDKSA